MTNPYKPPDSNIHPNNDLHTKEALQTKCQLMAQRIAMIHEFNSPDYSDKHLISNFIDTLIHIDYVKVYNTESLAYSEVFQKADKRIRLLISKEMRLNIIQMIKKQHPAYPL